MNLPWVQQKSAVLPLAGVCKTGLDRNYEMSICQAGLDSNWINKFCRTQLDAVCGKTYLYGIKFFRAMMWYSINRIQKGFCNINYIFLKSIINFRK